MAENATSRRDQMSRIAQLVVEGIRKVPEVRYAAQVSALTKHASDSNKIAVELDNGQHLNFSVTVATERKPKATKK